MGKEVKQQTSVAYLEFDQKHETAVEIEVVAEIEVAAEIEVDFEVGFALGPNL